MPPDTFSPKEEPGMFDFLRRFPWLLEVFRYDNLDGLLGAIEERVIGPARVAKGGGNRANRKHTI